MLKGKIVGLRAVEEKDLLQLMEWRNLPELRQYFREYREINQVKQRQWYEQKVLNDPGTLMFSIVNKENGELLGACGLCYIDWIHRSADFSIYIGKDNLYMDINFSVDAANVLIKYAFHDVNLHRLWCEIYDFDLTKKKILESLNFKLDGRHRQTHWFNGEWHDSLFYSRLSEEN